MIIIACIAIYVLIGNLFHRVLFPEQKPEVAGWFKPGQQLYSAAEGFRQTVIKQHDHYVDCTLQIEPFAAGPPKHIHTGFDETFQVQNGVLTVWVDGEIKKIRPGEVLHIPKGTPHQPYNETADTIWSRGSFSFPEKFAFHLAQVYAVMDSDPGFVHSSKAFFQMPLFQQNGFDSYLVEGPPVAVQKIIGFVVAPLSRLLGYKSYYRQF